ncbi:DUF4268 domain-containing protein [Oceanithermus profundus]
MSKLGRLERVDLREVWRHEERDFSAWLAQEENIELLGSELGIELEVLQQEAPVGSFQVDLLAEEANTGRKVIIENQLEPTNHDHLGKLITYAAGYDAEIVVWIVREVRDEHRRAIEWLNDHTDENIGFFLIRMEVWRIGDSPPAPKFHVVSQPNDWAKAVKKAVGSGQLSDTRLLQLEYWSSFNANADGKTNLRLRKPQPQHWHNVGLGSSVAEIAFTVNGPRKEIAVEVYIPDNKALFDCLHRQKNVIEDELGLHLDWQRLPGKKASRVKIARDGDYTNRSHWPEQHRWLLETAEAFKRVFAPRIRDCVEDLSSGEAAE